MYGYGYGTNFLSGDVRVPAQDLPLATVLSLGGYPRSSTRVGKEEARIRPLINSIYYFPGESQPAEASSEAPEFARAGR